MKLSKLLLQSIMPHKPDKLQSRIINASHKDRILVKAGPGTGKTAVACTRLAKLIKRDNLSPSKVWMISFTRTAVAEIQNRLHQYVGEDSYTIKVATLDSHVWKIHSGYDENAQLTGSYESNIETTLKLIQENSEVQQYLDEVEHLVVDEAQDFVDVRAIFVKEVIKKLNANCGITVFSDEAQAIYDFSEDDTNILNTSENSFVQDLEQGMSGTFKVMELNNVHRTSSSGLNEIFTAVRKELLERSKNGEPTFGIIKKRILENADSNDLNQNIFDSDMDARTLILFRTRAEALNTSQFSDKPHSLRMSGYQDDLPAWLAICFYDCEENQVSRSKFNELWSSRIKPIIKLSNPSKQWEKLVKIAGKSENIIDMRQLTKNLGQYRPPPDIVNQKYGLTGPVISTIHASKGREADNVCLFIPQTSKYKEIQQDHEETRVMFVGATRARLSLRTRQSQYFPGTKLESSGRTYKIIQKKFGYYAMVEIGRNGDIDSTSMVGTAHFNENECKHTHLFFKDRTDKITHLEAIAKQGSHWKYGITTENRDRIFCFFSKKLNTDLWTIANKLSPQKKSLKPPEHIKHLKSLGCKTIVLGPDDPDREKLNKPWANSGFILVPRIASFTKVNFQNKVPSWKKYQ